jgi:transglutaminase-like putative cysteine protease
VVPILVHWISDHTEFLPDPSPAEWLLDPVQSLDLILRDGVAQLDCDDVATLAAAMALSIGLRARFVVAAFHTPKAPYQHVWTEVSPSGGRWTPIDPTRPAQGFRAFPISRLFVEEV